MEGERRRQEEGIMERGGQGYRRKITPPRTKSKRRGKSPHCKKRLRPGTKSKRGGCSVRVFFELAYDQKNVLLNIPEFFFQEHPRDQKNM